MVLYPLTRGLGTLLLFNRSGLLYTSHDIMGALGNLVPLVILFVVVAGMGWVGYQVRRRPPQPTCALLIQLLQIYLYSNELAERGVRKMEKKNVVFTKDGARVGVKEVNTEDYADRTQRAFVKTWNAAYDDGKR